MSAKDMVQIENIKDLLDLNIASFKINGKLIEGNKFIMPAKDVEITDVVLNELFVIESEHNPYPNNLHYENNSSIGKIYGKEKGSYYRYYIKRRSPITGGYQNEI